MTTRAEIVAEAVEVQAQLARQLLETDAAREPDGFASIAMKLSEYRKIEPGKLEEMLFFDHPSGATRVRMSMQWKKDHVPGAQHDPSQASQSTAVFTSRSRRVPNMTSSRSTAPSPSMCATSSPWAPCRASACSAADAVVPPVVVWRGVFRPTHPSARRRPCRRGG